MIRFGKRLLVFLIVPLCVRGQASAEKPTLENIYAQAIGDFIKAANKKNPQKFDTLFIGKRKNAQPDDFPEISLPPRIENTQILLITPEAAVKSQGERESRIYINLVGWVNKQNAEFRFVVFSQGFVHQYDWLLTYNYHKRKNQYVPEKLEFKGLSPDK